MIAPTTATAPASDTASHDITGEELHAPEFRADPYPDYARWRRELPMARVLWGDPGRTRSRWVFRHADVVQALNDRMTFLKNAPDDGTPQAVHGIGPIGALAHIPSGMFFADDPRHEALRSAIELPFRASLSQVEATARQQAADAIAAIVARGTNTFELMTDYAIAVPSHTLFSTLGIPSDHWLGLRKLVYACAMAHDTMGPMEVRMNGALCSMALNGYCQALLRDPAMQTPDTLIGRMLIAGEAAGLTPLDIQVSLKDFMIAGYLSTTFLIGTGILRLVEHPDQLAMLRDRPELMAAAVSEMLRYDSPAQVVERAVAVATTLGGVDLAPGDLLRLVLASANRDEQAFERAETFDILRTDGHKAIPFGKGMHHCIGTPIALMVAPIAIQSLLDAFPVLQTTGATAWATEPYVRSPTVVPMTFERPLA